MRTFPVLYEMEPIGVGGSLEAVAEHIYCSVTCRSKDATMFDTPILPGDAEPSMDGLQCEGCNRPLVKDDTCVLCDADEPHEH